MKNVTIVKRGDGFGALYQNIIYAILYAEACGLTYVHKPIESIAHNYDNEPGFVSNLETLMNIQDYYKNTNNDKVESELELDNRYMYWYIEQNIDKYANGNSIKIIKDLFWENKNKNFFNNNNLNVAVHIRRPNIEDNRIEGANTPDTYYLNVIQTIRNKYDKNLLFHIYSQGDIANFKCFINDDVVFHLNENICDTFIGMVAADIFVMSASSFSYSAALVSDGIIYYLPFWHPPLQKWLC